MVRTRGAIEADGDFSADAARRRPTTRSGPAVHSGVGRGGGRTAARPVRRRAERTRRADRGAGDRQVAKQMKKSGGGKGVKFGSNPNDSLFIESVGIGESDVDLSSIDPADLTSDLRRATQTGKGFQSTRMEEEQRLASVRARRAAECALAHPQLERRRGLGQLGRLRQGAPIAQLDSLLLADAHHAQAKMLKKQLVQIVKDDETRARIYAINVLKAQQERGKFDVHMQNKVKPLLGRRCFIPSQVVNMPVSAQAEFLNAGKIEDSSIVEGVILKSAGGGLVWVYIFAERMPFRFWMADAQSWLGDEDKMELGLPITVKKEVQAAEAAVGEEDATRPQSGWRATEQEPLPDLSRMYGSGKGVSHDGMRQQPAPLPSPAAAGGGGGAPPASGRPACPYWGVVIGDKPPLVRAKYELKSAEVGRLPIGTSIRVINERVMPDGLRRAHIALEGIEKPHGWMTATTPDRPENVRAATAATAAAAAAAEDSAAEDGAVVDVTEDGGDEASRVADGDERAPSVQGGATPGPPPPHHGRPTRPLAAGAAARPKPAAKKEEGMATPRPRPPEEGERRRHPRLQKGHRSNQAWGARPRPRPRPPPRSRQRPSRSSVLPRPHQQRRRRRTYSKMRPRVSLTPPPPP